MIKVNNYPYMEKEGEFYLVVPKELQFCSRLRDDVSEWCYANFKSEWQTIGCISDRENPERNGIVELFSNDENELTLFLIRWVG